MNQKIWIGVGIVIIIIVLMKLIFKKKPTKQLHPSALKPENKSKPIECKLIDKTKINHDTYLFKFALPSKSHVLGIKVGECIMICEEINGEIVERKYTPVSTVDQLGTFDLLIKIYRPCDQFPKGGKLTSWIEHLVPDQFIHITGPYGRLNYEGLSKFKYSTTSGQKLQKSFSRVLMIAGGSGITPMYQIVQAVTADQSDYTKLGLLYANKTETDILLKQELEQYQSIKKIDLHFTLDNPPPGWQGFERFVTKEMLTSAFGKIDSKTLCLICGPPIMNTTVEKNLLALGVSQESIFIY